MKLQKWACIAVALGIILLSISLVINLLVTVLQRRVSP